MKSNSCYKFLLLLLLLCGAGWASAQTSTVKVTGTLLTQEGKPLDYATVSLLQAKDSAIVKGALSSEAGVYTFNNVKAGTYIIRATAVGYTKVSSKPFAASGNEIIIPALVLATAQKALNEVTITGIKPLIERQADKTVMNVENSVLAAGNSAIEILQRAPGVTIDKDDNISLKGKQGVTVMINDKLTYLSSSELASLLRSTDGSTIQSIELITNPSAKYDAAGNSGIINIKLKKNKQVGTNGSITAGAGYGRYYKDNTSLNLNHRDGKLNLFTTLSRGDNKRYNQIELNRNVQGTNGNNTYFTQNTDFINQRHFNNYRVGADYDFSSKNTAGFVVSGYINRESDKGDTRTRIGKVPGQPDTLLTTLSTVPQQYNNVSVNLNDRYQIDTTGQQLAVDLDYLRYKNNTQAQYDAIYQSLNGGTTRPPSFIRNQTPSTINIYTGKADYTYPFSKTLKIETGLKFSNVKTDNDLQAQKSADGVNYINDAGRTNHFLYSENIDAAYLNLNNSFKKTSVQAGLRAEYTRSDGNLITQNNQVKRSYLNFFPSIFINHEFSDKHSLGITYSRRIDRPNYEDLNPFFFYLDQYSYQQGNPFLRPQYTNAFELNYSYKKTINISAGYSRTTDVITELLYSDTISKATIITKTNLNVQNNYNLSLNTPYTVTKWWTGTVNATAFYLGFKTDTSANGPLNNGKIAYNLQSTQTYILGKSYKAELTGDYQSSLVYGYFHVKPQYSIDAGISHSFANKKANIKFAVNDIFNMRRNDVNSVAGGNVIMIRQKNETRVFRLNFTYNFGNSKIKGSSHRTAVDEGGRVKGAN
ncbi:TonB-dependent receptor domain-containing protein [Mucilaginibacter sp.]